MTTRERWGRGLFSLGAIAMLAGAVDPVEGSLAILPGSALMALGASMAGMERSAVRYGRVAFVLVAIGVGFLWGTSMRGGFGGPSGLSPGWGLLLVPYPVGWVMGVLARDNPRWLTWGAMAIGSWFVAIPFLVLARSAGRPPPAPLALVGVGLFGTAVIVGAVVRLRQGRRRAR
jgi:hypothetical protein